MNTVQDHLHSLRQESGRLVVTDDYLRFLRTTADHLLALDLGLVNGQVIPTQIRDSTRGEIRRILVDAFERLSTLDGEIAMSWLSGLAQERAAAIGNIDALEAEAASQINYFIEVPESESAIAPRIQALQALGPKILALDSPYPLRAPTFGRGHSRRTIDRFQTERGIRLPGNYRDFVNRCGLVEGLDFFPTYCLADLFNVESLLLETEVGSYCGSESVFPVGTDGGGTLFLGELSEPCRIYRWDQFSPVDRSDPVANSFCELLEVISGDWRKFLAQEAK